MILVRVVMNSVADKIAVLKVSKHLKGSNIYIREDLSPNERRRRKVLVAEMKKLGMTVEEHTLDSQMGT